MSPRSSGPSALPATREAVRAWLARGVSRVRSERASNPRPPGSLRPPSAAAQSEDAGTSSPVVYREHGCCRRSWHVSLASSATRSSRRSVRSRRSRSCKLLQGAAADRSRDCAACSQSGLWRGESISRAGPKSRRGPCRRSSACGANDPECSSRRRSDGGPGRPGRRLRRRGEDQGFERRRTTRLRTTRRATDEAKPTTDEEAAEKAKPVPPEVGRRSAAHTAEEAVPRQRTRTRARHARGRSARPLRRHPPSETSEVLAPEPPTSSPGPASRASRG